MKDYYYTNITKQVRILFTNPLVFNGFTFFQIDWDNGFVITVLNISLCILKKEEE